MKQDVFFDLAREAPKFSLLRIETWRLLRPFMLTMTLSL